MPRTAKADPAARGIYLRKKSYWLRYSYAKQQLRVPLHTRDFIAAIEEAKKIRGTAKEIIAPKLKAGETPTWKIAIASYIADKLAGMKGATKVRKFRPGTATRTSDILRTFGKETKKRSPFEVDTPLLQKFYDTRKKKSVASARTIVDRVCCFLAHIGHAVAKPHYDEEDVKETRDVVVAPALSGKLIDECPGKTLMFVLYAGFHCGMRRNEIVHARPAWIDLDAAIPFIKVPAKETQRLANGKTYQWRSKNGKERKIPLGSEFAGWLRKNLDRKTLFVIKPECCSKRYRYDPRSAFETYVAKHERQDITMHAMRHSYITNLCNSGNPTITIMKVSAWSGDKIETIERHYWHKDVSSEGLDETLSGKKRKSESEKLDELLELVAAGKMTPEEARESLVGLTAEQHAMFHPDHPAAKGKRTLHHIGAPGIRKRAVTAG